MSLETFGRLFKPCVNKSTVLRWERKGVPLDRVLDVEKVTGVPRSVLRPDFFAEPAEAAE